MNAEEPMRKQLNFLGYKNDRRIKPGADPIEDSSEADFHDHSNKVML